MSMHYVRVFYGVPAKRGMIVTTEYGKGVITSATNYVHVRLNGEKHPRRFHPDDIKYPSA